MKEWQGVAIKREDALPSIFTVRCWGGQGTGLEDILPAARTTYFAYGRQALAEGLHRAGVGPGDQVLLPEFICADVLGSLALVGATPRYYKVAPTLGIEEGTLEAYAPIGIRALIAINYFGFPQNLSPFLCWSRAHGVPLIEDNAHGFLSAAGGAFLGCRGDWGVFSLRKTLSVPNGAALVDNRGTVVSGNRFAFEGSSCKAERRHRVKTFIKLIMRHKTVGAARIIVSAIRSAKSAGGVSLPAFDAETAIPREAYSSLTARLLKRCDFQVEKERRRSLYRYCTELFADVPEVQPLFQRLPDDVVPQGFPFRYTGSDRKSFQEAWWRRGLPIVVWPDRLPASVRASAPDHYRTTMLVQFLW